MRSTLLVAAVGGCVAASLFAGEPKNTQGPVFPQGMTGKQLNDQQDVRSVLAEATNAAAKKGAFDDMVERLATPDRKRIGDFAEREFSELDGRIEQIRKNWQEKYGQTLDLSSDKIFEGFVVIHEGEVTDAVAARTNWPIPVRQGQKVAGNAASNEEYLQDGRSVAIVSVSASHSLPEITISMIREPVDDWRIDIPDDLTGPQLYENVKAALTNLGDNVASWPADVNEANRAFGHRLLMALYNVPQTESNKSASADR